MAVEKVIVPARFVPEEVIFRVVFKVQGGETCAVNFKTEAEAEFYDNAFARGYLQVIQSRYYGNKFEEYNDCVAFVFSQLAERFKTKGFCDVTCDEDIDRFTHGSDRFEDWAFFMQFFPTGTKVSTARNDASGRWRAWNGNDWEYCESPYDCSALES